jgi:hypothetical protein
MFIGILGARKYRDRQSVMDFVRALPADPVIVTSSCRGVCTWAASEARTRGLQVITFSPDLCGVRSKFEVAQRYYERNRKLIEACDVVHAFISQEGGFTGGTKFEVEHARRLEKPVELHWENGTPERIRQYSLSLREPGKPFFSAWEDFFVNTFG